MTPHILRFGTGVAFLVILLSSSSAQPPPMKDKDKDKAPPPRPPAARGVEDYRQYFKKPETVDEYWRAMQFEIDVGQYGLAALHLRGLVTKPPTDDDLLQLEAKYGMAAFLKLRTLPRWSEDKKLNDQALADVEELNRLVVAAVKKKLADRERVVKYVRALTSEPEEVAFAMRELAWYRGLVVPPLVDELRRAEGDDRRALLRALRKLPDVVPPLVAALDSNDPNLVSDVLGVLKDRGAKEAVPHLWYVSASPTYPERVRARAAEVLAYLLDVPASKLPPAKLELTRQAERYYRHQVPFVDPEKVVVWRWEKNGIVQGWPGAETVPGTKAEEYYGLRYAREALALDPTYQPAQELFLSLTLDKTLETADLAQPLAKISPRVHELLTGSSPDVLVAVLERALTDQRSAVALACVRALGELAEVRASKPTGRGEPALVRALFYGDKRVQMAAAEALLRMPTPPSSQATQRVLEVLNRNLAVAGTASLKPKAIVASGDDDRRRAILRAVADAGYEPVPAATGRDALRRLNKANDISAIVLESTLPDPGLASFLGQVKADVNASRLPVVLIAVPDNVDTRDLLVKYQAERDRFDFLARKTADYRRLRQETQAKYEREREQLAKSATYATEAERQQAFALLEDRYKQDLANLVRQFPEAAVFDKETQGVEGRLKALGEKYGAECRRREGELRRWLEGSPTVSVVSTAFLDDPGKLQARLQGEEGKTETKPLTEAEQKDYAERSIAYFARIARGEITGYDVRPYAETVYNALRGGKLSEKGQSDAIDVVARLSAPRSQVELAAVVLDDKRPLPLRLKATDDLTRHIQQHSLLLPADQVGRLRKLSEDAGKVPELADFKAKLAALQGSLRPDARLTGERLRDYQPPPPAPPPMSP
jgi:hypothetical protein